MSITLRQLRYVTAVATHQSFRRAAAALHVSQPAMTAQVQLLEAQLGAPVLTRSRRGVSPTPFGQAVLDQAHTVLAEVEQLTALGREAAAQPLRLGVIPTIAPYLGAEAIDIGGRISPHGLALIEGKTAELLDGLRDGTLDGALLALPADGAGLAPDLVGETAFVEPFLALLPAGDSLADQVGLRLADLRRRPLLLLEEGHCLADQTLALCGPEAGPAPLRAGSLAVVVRLVAKGHGVSVLPAMAIAHDCHRGDGTVTRPLSDPGACRRIGLAWRRGARGERAWRRLAAALARLAPAAPGQPAPALAAE